MSTKRSRGTQSHKVSLSVVHDSPIGRAELLGGKAELPATLDYIVNAYFDLVHHFRPKHDVREQLAIFDALGERWQGTLQQVHNLPREVMETLTSDLLDTKWCVDPQKLKTRLDRMSYAERRAVAAYSRAFWSMASEDESPQMTLDRVGALFQRDISHVAESQRPRRISAERFRQGETLSASTVAADDTRGNNDTEEADGGHDTSAGDNGDLQAQDDVPVGPAGNSNGGAEDESSGDAQSPA